MFFGMPGERFLKFVSRHLRQHDVLNDDGVSVHPGGDLHCFDLVLGENICNGSGDSVQLHYLSVDNRISRQGLIAQAYELEVTVLALQFDGFDGTRSDINADHALVTTFPHHQWLLAILNISRRWRRTRARARRARDRPARTNLIRLE